MLNIHDIRSLNKPTSSVLINPSGTISASFQAHSGLMSTVSALNPKGYGVSLDLSTLSLGASKPRAHWGLHRSTMSRLDSVTEETVFFDTQDSMVESLGMRPYTVVHPLRPFLGVGYGSNCWMKGSGIGKGDDTDSGSYSFLRAQAKFVL
jgi:regulator-associated protein of mTOR